MAAVEELQKTESLMHPYAIPTTHDITDHCIKGTQFGKFRSKSFPTAEEFFREIGALSWFNETDDEIEKYKNQVAHGEIDFDFDLEEKDNADGADDVSNENTKYGVNREQVGLPTMDLMLVDVRPAGLHPVFDITVDKVHSFLANGVVAHNCIGAHGATTLMRERLFVSSDPYAVSVCNECGLIAACNDEKHIHLCNTCENRTNFSTVPIPYACKLLFQELESINVIPRIITTDSVKH